MTGGTRILLLGSSLLMTGCVTDQNYHVRAIADPGAKFRYAGTLIAQGRAQLALGNVGLALETFRKAQREQPPSADTFAGIAACYAAMGRYDLARGNYEFALAYAPSDANLLTALATSLEQLGEGEQAAQVRAEASRLAAASAAAAEAEEATLTPVSVPRVSSITVALPPPAPVAAAPVRPATRSIPKATAVAEQGPAPAITAPQLTPAVIKMSSAALTPKKVEWPASVEISGPAPTGATQEVAPTIAAPKLGPATVKLSHAAIAPRESELASNDKVTIQVPIEAPQVPMPKIAASHPMAAAIKPASVSSARGMTPPASNVAMLRAAPKEELRSPVPPIEKRQPAVPADGRREALVAQVEPRLESGPYLERLSLGEVSLVTSPAPVRIAHSRPHSPPPARTDIAMDAALAQPAPRLASAAAVRWVPLKYAPPQAPIELLNAARTQSLAARMRVALLDHGWRKVRIGNARKIRQHSLVLYASARWAVARRLAAHFGCKAVKTDKVRNVVVLLGRDAALPRRTSARV